MTATSQAADTIPAGKLAADTATRAEGYPVNPHYDTIFYIYEGFGAFKAQDRAVLISSRIEELERKTPYHPDSLTFSETEVGNVIAYLDMGIMAVTDGDARMENMGRLELTQKRISQINGAVARYRQEFAWSNLMRKVALILLLLLVLSGIIFGVNRMFRHFYKWLSNRLIPRMHGIRVGSAVLTNEKQTAGLLITMVRYLKWIIILVIVYLALPLIIYLIPSSKGITNALLRYTLTPLTSLLRSFVDFIPNLFTILVVIVIFGLINRLFRFIFSEIANGSIVIRGFYKEWGLPTFSIIRFVLIAFMFIIIFPYLPGSGSPIFQGVSVFLGFLISLGSAGSISNMIAGIVITYMRSFDMGDRIRIGEVEGDVVEKSLFVTRIRTIKNEEFSVPNSVLMNGNVKNYSKLAREFGLILHTTVTIGYDAPWRKVHQALLDAASRTPAIEKQPAPFVFQNALSDFYVEYQINGYTRNAGRMVDTYSALHQNIQDAFNDAGIEIMSAHYTSLRDGNTTTIPESYRPGDYVKPGFDVQHK